MTTNITLDKARELLDTARQEATDGQRPVTVAASHAPLAEAAPALAQTVASMHYEYAVLLEDMYGTKRFAKGSHTHTSYIDLASWSPSPNEFLADYWRENEPELKVSVIRRLKGDPEVVE